MPKVALEIELHLIELTFLEFLNFLLTKNECYQNIMCCCSFLSLVEISFKIVVNLKKNHNNNCQSTNACDNQHMITISKTFIE